MRIGFLLPANYSVGNPGNGVRAQARFQAQALRRLGHEVIELTPWHDHSQGLDVLHFFQGGFAHYGIEPARNAGYKALVFAPIIDSNEPNIRYRLAAQLSSISAKVFTIPGVLQAQCRSSDMVVCRSQHERARIVAGLGIDAEKVRVVLNGVERPAARAVDSNADADPDANQHAHPDTNASTAARLLETLPASGFILHVSAYTQARKNVLRLVEAVGPLGIPLVIAGAARPGPVMERLKRLAGDYPTVRLLSFVDEALLHALYRACKVFCLPSLHEGTGLVALEAAAHGAQVVITRNGGPPDYFGSLAHYVDPLDVQDLRRAVESAWNAPSSKALRRHVTTELTWDRSAAALTVVYEAALAGAQARGALAANPQGVHL